MSPPYSNSSRDVSGSDPLAVGGVTSDSDGIAVVAINGNVERAIKVSNEDRPSIAIKDGVGFGIAGDYNSTASLRGRDACIGFYEIGHFVFLFIAKRESFGGF